VEFPNRRQARVGWFYMYIVGLNRERGGEGHILHPARYITRDVSIPIYYFGISTALLKNCKLH